MIIKNNLLIFTKWSTPVAIFGAFLITIFGAYSITDYNFFVNSVLLKKFAIVPQTFNRLNTQLLSLLFFSYPKSMFFIKKHYIENIILKIANYTFFALNVH